MADPLPKIANGDRFIDRGESASGEVSLEQLPRLTDYVPDDFATAETAPLAWSMRGVRDSMGHRALEITVRGVVPVVCQRCLTPLLWPVDQQATVLIAKSQKELIELDETSDLEVVLCERGIDVQTLVEDELLLSLPFAPLHDVCPGETTDQ